MAHGDVLYRAHKWILRSAPTTTTTTVMPFYEYLGGISEHTWTHSAAVERSTLTLHTVGQEPELLDSEKKSWHTVPSANLLIPLSTFRVHKRTSGHAYTGPHTNTQYSCCVSNPERPELWEQGECSAAGHNGVSHSGQSVETHTCSHTHSLTHSGSWRGGIDTHHTHSSSASSSLISTLRVRHMEPEGVKARLCQR